MSKNSKTNEKKNNKEVVDSRFSTLKSFSVASIVIFITLAIILNVFLYLAFDKVMTLDMSATKQNTVSPVIVDYIKNLPGDSEIRIVALFEKPLNTANTPYAFMIPLLDDLEAKSSGRVKVDYIDQKVNPGIIRELDPNNIYTFNNSAFSYYVCYEGIISELNPNYCFSFDSSYLAQGKYVVSANNVNVALGNVIYNITNPDHSKAYFLTGLDSTGYGMDSHTYLDVMLNSLCIDTADLPISNDFVIPDDCDVLFISGINMDITENAAVKLIEYINNGGKLFVAIDFYYSPNVDFINLNNVLHEVNLHLDPYVITESDTEHMLDMSGYQNYVDIESAYSGIITSNKVRASYVRPVRKFDNPHSYIEVDAVLTSSENANVSGIDQNGGVTVLSPEPSQYNAAMHGTFTGVTVPPEVYVFGSTDFTTDMYLSVYGLNDYNAQFIKNLVKNVVGTKGGLDIQSIPVADYSIDVAKATTKTTAFFTFLYIVILPLGFVIAAAVVYNKRKNL